MCSRSCSGLSEEEDQKKGYSPEGYQENVSEEEEQNQSRLLARSSSSSLRDSLRSASLPADSDPLGNANTNPTHAAALPMASQPASAAAAAAAASAILSAPTGNLGRGTHQPGAALPSTSAQRAPARAVSGPFTASGAGLENQSQSKDSNRLKDDASGHVHNAAAQVTASRPPHSGDIALLQKQLQQLHSRQVGQLQDQTQQQQLQVDFAQTDTRPGFHGSLMAGQNQPNPAQATTEGQSDSCAAGNSPSGKGSGRSDWAFAQLQQQQHQEAQQRRSASPAVQHRASPSPEAALLAITDRISPYADYRASPSPHADRRASPAPHAEQAPPQPTFQRRASPDQPRAVPAATSSPVAQMMVLPSQLKLPPPQITAIGADQVSCTFNTER